MLGQKLKVEKRTHPFGAQGVNTSLEQVAKKISEGSVHPKVRAWAIECLDRARKERGIKVDNERQRAEVLLRAVQKKLWVPDPVGAEWMAGAHLTACDTSDANDICFHGSDCDDLCILLGSCLLGVGIHTLIVGHSYNDRKEIGHVLCAARVDGKWLYADPSTDFPLGKCAKFTRERILSSPSVKVLCDDTVCIADGTGWDPDKEGFVTRGEFVGVNGPPQPILQWVGQFNMPQFPETPSEGAGGAAAGAGACTAAGAPGLAPICAKVGAWGEAQLKKAFGAIEAGYKAQKEEFKRQEAGQNATIEADDLMNDAFRKVMADLELFAAQNGVRITPPQLAEMLNAAGVPVVTRDMVSPPFPGWIAPPLSQQSGPFNHLSSWAICGQVIRGGKLQSGVVDCHFRTLRGWARELEIATVVVATQLLTGETTEEVTAFYEVVNPAVFRKKTPRKKKSVVPVVVGVGIAGALVWFVLL